MRILAIGAHGDDIEVQCGGNTRQVCGARRLGLYVCGDGWTWMS
jgi:LmbE family N-acetylglucosaminyl deacetylase